MVSIPAEDLISRRPIKFQDLELLLYMYVHLLFVLDLVHGKNSQKTSHEPKPMHQPITIIFRRLAVITT